MCFGRMYTLTMLYNLHMRRQTRKLASEEPIALHTSDIRFTLLGDKTLFNLLQQHTHFVLINLITDAQCPTGMEDENEVSKHAIAFRAA
jgi:hypothetical protein